MEEPDATWAPQSPDLSAYQSTEAHFVHPQHQSYRGSSSSSISISIPTSHPAPFTPPSSIPIVYKQPPPMPRGVKREDTIPDPDYLPDASTKAMGKQAKANNGGESALASTTDSIVIKNHFPVARIKRIMQADDDVGKVAQVTPVVVSKALELFMISLVTKAAAEAKARNSKRVAPAHLKQVVVGNEQFDFLSDIVAKVADPPAAADKSSDGMDVDGKRRKAPARRKKKTEDDDF